MPNRKFKSICVYCGSSTGTNTKYTESTARLGTLLAKSGIRLIYGAGNLGLMGTISKTIADAGGKVLGVTPSAFHDVFDGELNGETVVVNTMHERKAIMSKEADAFIALPGGFGTMEELVETITWSQLRIHAKPIGILNIDGFFDAFVMWMDRAVKEGFISEKARQIVVIKNDPDELMDALHSYEDPLEGPDYFLKKEMWLVPGDI